MPRIGGTGPNSAMADLVAETIPLPGGPLPVLWRRSVRASRVGLRIDPHAASVVITLPAGSSRQAGLRFVGAHAGWVRGQLAALPPGLVFADGASIPVAGIPHPVRHDPAGAAVARFDGGAIHVGGNAGLVGPQVTALLRAEAGRQFGLLVAEICGRAALRANRVTIRDTRSRWGSCSPRGTVMFNWRLVMAPAAVQRYAAAHEVAHLRHMNHSERFWALVETLAPGKDAPIAWLRQHGGGLLRAGCPAAEN